MYINIENVLKSQNKSMYWLAEQTGISYPTIFNLSKNKTESIKFDILEKICFALQCTPNDIIHLSPLTHD